MSLIGLTILLFEKILSYLSLADRVKTDILPGGKSSAISELDGLDILQKVAFIFPS